MFESSFCEGKQVWVENRIREREQEEAERQILLDKIRLQGFDERKARIKNAENDAKKDPNYNAIQDTIAKIMKERYYKLKEDITQEKLLLLCKEYMTMFPDSTDNDHTSFYEHKEFDPFSDNNRSPRKRCNELYRRLKEGFLDDFKFENWKAFLIGIKGNDISDMDRILCEIVAICKLIREKTIVSCEIKPITKAWKPTNIK